MTLRWLWAAPWTVAGLLLAGLALLGGARVRIVRGTVLEVAGGPVAAWAARRAPYGVAALTLGHVILGRDAATLAALREHELAHVRQYEAWGPMFVPAYLASSLWQWLRGGDPYRDNVFERAARAAEAAAALAGHLPFTPRAAAPAGEGPAAQNS